jgi:methionine synthase II (cobalamin-independent)
MRVTRGLATGVGSLPHIDADSGLDMIFKYVAKAPFWPQFPKRDFREGMVAQFSENIPCLEVKDGSVIFNSRDKEKKLEAFYERIISEDADYFKISREFSLGLHKFYERINNMDLGEVEFIKIQVTGPFTFLAGVNDEYGRSLLHDPVFKQAVIKALSMKLRWQIDLFRKFAKPIVAFIDEPYLGAFGSAYTPINRDDVVRGLSELGENVSGEGVYLGVHCCGNTDWSMFTDVPGISVINFDAYNFQEKFVLYADSLKGFLARGGVICWGIVPTQELRPEDNVELLASKLRQGIDNLAKKGVDKDLILENLIISPACGLGTFTPQKADKVFSLLSETSCFIRKNL